MDHSSYKQFLDIASPKIAFKDIGHTSRASFNNQLQLEASFAEVSMTGSTSLLGEVRSVLLTSEKVEVFSFFFYPSPGLDHPIFACEFVNLNNKRLVVALDTPCFRPFEGSCVTRKLLDLMTDQFGSLPEQEMPQWYAECASSEAVFWKSDDLSKFEEIVQNATSFWTRFSNVIDPHRPVQSEYPADVADLHSDHIQQYKHHHCVNSPGLPLMKASFGEQWSHEFMHDRFFA